MSQNQIIVDATGSIPASGQKGLYFQHVVFTNSAQSITDSPCYWLLVFQIFDVDKGVVLGQSSMSSLGGVGNQQSGSITLVTKTQVDSSAGNIDYRVLLQVGPSNAGSLIQLISATSTGSTMMVVDLVRLNQMQSAAQANMDTMNKAMIIGVWL